jgi:hypothetical protein
MSVSTVVDVSLSAASMQVIKVGLSGLERGRAKTLADPG